MAKLIIRKFGIKTSIILIFINIFTKTTQKQNNEENNEAWAKYEQELAEYRKGKGISNPNGISTGEIVQALTLGREPQAKVSISQLNGKPGRVDPTHQQNTDSASYEYYLNPDNTGVALVATYTGLKNSYYYDSDGNKHNIAKIVRTFSNVTKQNWIHSWDWEKNPENNGNPYIWLYDDPTDGFWYYYASGITVTDQFFDENGNPISLNNNAWLAVTSLNNQGSNNKVLANDADVEQVTALSGGEAYALLGSSVTNHNGTLYANSNNTDGTGHNNGAWWDSRGDNEYYGSGLIKLSGNSVSLRFSTHYDPSFTGATSHNVWATTTTIIPETPGPRKPEPKYTTINYHYDTILTLKLIIE